LPFLNLHILTAVMPVKYVVLCVLNMQLRSINMLRTEI
jgi:hypothetical protein